MRLKYVTKKQVDSYITKKLEDLTISESELSREVKYVLFDLKEFPDDNKNQIKFFTRVYEKLN